MEYFNARNPLGIVALFISLIYGIAALLLGTSVDNISADNQDFLVLFVIAFPVAVLLAFLFLVTRHHKKLYGPGDFRSDEGFLSAADPSQIGTKYQTSEGVLEDQSNPAGESGASTETPAVAGVDASGKALARTATFSTAKQFPSGVARAYLVEGLVLQDLQDEFKSPMRRDVRLSLSNGRNLIADGVVETSDGPIVVEIKYMQSRNPESSLRGLDTLIDAVMSLRTSSDAKVRGILALVYSGNFEYEPGRELENYKATFGGKAPPANVEIRFFSDVSLLRKYGMAPAIQEG